MVEEGQGYGNYPIMQNDSYNSKESLIYQLENDEILERIYHAIRCELPQYNAVTGDVSWITPKGITPLINAMGARSILIDLQSRINKIFILSDLHEDLIADMVINVGQNLTEELMVNWDLYNVKDQSSASKIVKLVCDAVYSTLMKAKNKNYLTYLSKISQMQEIKHSQEGYDNKKKGGVLSSFLPQSSYE